MAVSSCRRRKEVMCVIGALRSPVAYLWRNFGTV